MTKVTDLPSVFSSVSPTLGVQVKSGGRTGQGLRAEQFSVTGVPSSTSSLAGDTAGRRSESDESNEK